MTESFRSDSSKPLDDNEREVENIRHAFRSNAGPGRIKNSGCSSDEETSSSLLPIPETLRQMRGELKRIITDTREPSDADSSCCSAQGVIEHVVNPLDEFRRKYSLQKETSVAMKMNSANLILDDILNNSSNNNSNNNNSINIVPHEGYKQKYFRNQDFNVKKTQECNYDGPDSLSMVNHCEHAVLGPVLGHCHPPMSCELAHVHCPKHDKSFQLPWNYSSITEKGLQISNQNENMQKKLSFLKKFQNHPLKYRIQSVYKIVQKNNPFAKDRRTDVPQGIPHSRYSHNPGVIKECDGHKCDNLRSSEKQYPRRMIFDLVESSDISQSDDKSVTRIQTSRSSTYETECTCSNQNRCTCPEEPRVCHFELPKIASESISCPLINERVQPQPHVVVNGMARAESFINLNTSNSNKGCINVKTPSSVPPRQLSDHVLNQKEKEEQLKNLRKELEKENRDRKKYCFKGRKLIERTDIYYFDHGNSAYYRTTDNHPVRFTECLVERTDEYATKFWGEIFGVFEVGIAFIISFLLQLYRFFFASIIRSLIVGLLQISSDYFFKPLLTIIFNGLIQPCLILAYNTATSFRDLCLPFSQVFGFFIREVANLFKSCRLVDVNHNHCSLPACHCENKV